jgi:hypothetical protein
MGGTRGVFGRNRESRSREVRFLHPGYGTAGVGILPKQRPSKSAAEKGKCAETVHVDHRGRDGQTQSLPWRAMNDTRAFTFAAAHG